VFVIFIHFHPSVIFTEKSVPLWGTILGVSSEPCPKIDKCGGSDKHSSLWT
jgi:hypothetical protein